MTARMGAPFADRADAGRRLAQRLRDLAGPDVVVLGLPRGGVPVAAEVARELGAPLDVIVVRKLGLPINPEVAMGAIGEGHFEVLDQGLVSRVGVTAQQVRAVEAQERSELDARVRRLRQGHEPLDLTGRTAVIVDDGIATGATARVASRVARHLGAQRVVVAAPVAPAGLDIADADDVVVLHAPELFGAVGLYYRDFSPTSDEEVAALLAAAARRGPERGATVGAGFDGEVRIPVGQGPGGLAIGAHLSLPHRPRGVVAFAHGSGSSRHSPRNRYVASVLQRAGLGTLLLDLLTPQEEGRRESVFDIELLAGRLAAALRWLRERDDVGDARLGLFGASTGAAAALWAAADPSLHVAAVVSRGGRPDLAMARLGDVAAPTLLVVGGADPAVLQLNRVAAARLATVRLEIVPGAGHLFEEPGTLAQVAVLARDWFRHYLVDAEDARAGSWRVAR